MGSDTAGSLEEAAARRNEWDRAQPAEGCSSAADVPHVRRDIVEVKGIGCGDVVDVRSAIAEGKQAKESVDSKVQHGCQMCGSSAEKTAGKMLACVKLRRKAGVSLS